MELVRRYGKPDLFITLTTNPMWPEVTSELRHNQEPADRPELGSRIFMIKLVSF